MPRLPAALYRELFGRAKQAARQIRVILHAKRCPHYSAAASDEVPIQYVLAV